MKSLGIGAGALAAPGVLTGCSGGSGGSSGEALSLWNFYGDDGTDSPQSTWWVDLVKKWNENNDQQVELRYLTNATYLDGTTLQTAFTAGEGPDIFLLSPGDFLRYVNGGVLRDLSDKMSDDIVADFQPALLDARSVDGAIYGIPFEAEPLAIYYSVSAFEKAGLSEGDIPETWDQFYDIAGELTTPDQFGSLFATTPGYYQNFTWYPFMWQGDGRVVRKDGTVAFDDAAAVDALDFWGRLIDDGYAARNARGDGASDSASNLGSGAVAMQQSGIWDIATLRQKNPDFEYGVFKLPHPEGKESVTSVGGWAICVNADGKDPDGAAEFAVWAMADQSKEGRERALAWNTEAKTNMPARESVIELAQDKGVWSDGPLQYFADEVAPTGRAEPRLPPEVYKAVSDAIQNVQLSGADGKTEAAKAADTISGFMSTYDGASIAY